MSFDLIDGLDDDMILESAILHEDWRDKYIVRSLTKEESSKLKEFGYKTVPVTFIDDYSFVGFNVDGLRQVEVLYHGN